MSLWFCRRAKEYRILKRLYGFGEEALNRLAQELLSNPTFTAALSTAVQKGFETKGRLDKNVQSMLGLLNLPSRADVGRIMTKLEVIQGTLLNLSLKVDRLAETRKPAARKRHPRKPTTE